MIIMMIIIMISIIHQLFGLEILKMAQFILNCQFKKYIGILKDSHIYSKENIVYFTFLIYTTSCILFHLQSGLE
jgi:hypothetical protein